MDAEEMRKIKRSAELQIKAVLIALEKKTGLSVVGVELLTDQSVGGGRAVLEVGVVLSLTS